MKVLYQFINRLFVFAIAIYTIFTESAKGIMRSSENGIALILGVCPRDASPYPEDPKLSAIVIGYRNNKLIAEQAMPRVTVAKQQFKYLLHNIKDGYNVINNLVGRKGDVQKVEFSAKEKADQCEDYALADLVPQNDIDNAPNVYDPLSRAALGIADLNLLAREVRVASILFNPNSYRASNVLTLSGTSQFSDYVNSDPIKVIKTAMSKLLIRPNTMVIGMEAWDVISMHPKVVQTINGTYSTAGLIDPEQLAKKLRLDQILIGEAFINSANKGQDMSLVRAWGKHISLFFNDPIVQTTTEPRPTFALTAQNGTDVGYQYPDPDKGLKGGIVVKAGHSLKEFIAGPDCGYFLQNVIS